LPLGSEPPNPSSCPRLPLKLPRFLGWKGLREGGSGEEWWRAGLRVVGGIAGGLKGVREEA